MNRTDAMQLLKRISYTDDRVLPANEDDQLLKAEEWAYQLGDATLNEAITAYREMSRIMGNTPGIRDIVTRCTDNTDRQHRHHRQIAEREAETARLKELDS